MFISKERIFYERFFIETSFQFSFRMMKNIRHVALGIAAFTFLLCKKV